MAELMSPQILLLLLMCSLQLEFPAVEAAGFPNTTLARHNCTPTCGTVTIPFPFGIGPGCFLDDWYEISCEVNNTVPRLKKLDLQVLNISLNEQKFFNTDSVITVDYPIIHSKSSCKRNDTRDPVSLQGSPFTFSSSSNKFLAVGCNSVAIMETDANSSFVGCKTHCAGANYTGMVSACDGFGCCQSMIPSDLQGFHVDLRPENSTILASSGDQDCQYGFLASNDWFQPNKTDVYALRDGDYGPVVLNWGILDSSLPKSLGLQLDWTVLSGDEPAECRTTSYVNKSTAPLIRCSCNDGFIGNPYLRDGCLDVNECELPEWQLPDWQTSCYPQKCVNIPGNYECSNGKRTVTSLIIGLSSSSGSLVLIFLAWWMYKLIKKRSEAKLKEKFFKRNGGMILQQQLTSPDGNVEKSKLFNSKELEKATDYFNKDRILGKGGQGTVYKGMLTDGRIVAVKKSISIDEKNIEPFINEVVILSQINHRNIVKLLGCCLESEFPLLVYEFIPNGTLYEYLHDPEFPVSWEARLRIATEVASGLFYLHSSASIPIYHRDIKSSNILLDEKHRAKIADFGTSRSGSLDQTHVTTVVQGTFGYLDPEYFRSGQFTEKSDVYSFGIVLVELLTGQKPTASLLGENCIGLASSFVTAMEEDRLFEILDPPVRREGGEAEIIVVANLAKRCLNLKGRKRPSMKDIVIELEAIRNRSQPVSSLAQHQEKANHANPDELEGDDALSISRGSEADVEQSDYFGRSSDISKFSSYDELRSELAHSHVWSLLMMCGTSRFCHQPEYYRWARKASLASPPPQEEALC
ncbi:hypothetical protein CDL15_Pgr002967 [Punica granatum]|uniref:Protein kinase domain-containing protein n=1 Tax=Punica granatum TaxID=22663 RepID=A0A218X268_PUNGR|nr:hypothetical protein CDL15_Pgr002967 [Punica granatum]